jgi:hypothetical protein
MDDYLEELNRWNMEMDGAIFPYGSSPPHAHWGMLDPHLSSGYLLMPFGEMAQEVIVAVMYPMDIPEFPIFRNVRLLTSLAAFFLGPGPIAASELYASYYTQNCSCPLVTYWYLPISLIDISNAFLRYVDLTGYRVELVGDSDEDSIAHYWAERREGDGKTLECTPVGDCYTDPEIITSNTISGTAFQRLIGRMLAIWGMVFDDYHLTVGNETIDGWKGTDVIRRRDIRCQPTDDGLRPGFPPVPIIIQLLNQGNIAGPNTGIGIKQPESECIGKYTLMYNGEVLTYNGETVVYE